MNKDYNKHRNVFVGANKMTLTWNQQVVKRNNKSLVFQMIKEQAPISRADIAQRLGLNKSTVSSLVTELVEEELSYETGPGESSGGRRPVMLLFNQQAGYSIGIDIGVNYILGVLTDLQGNIVTEKSLSTPRLGYQDVLNYIYEIMNELLASVPPSRYGVVGIGVGVPGIVDKEGQVLLAPNLGWEKIQLKQKLEEMYRLPIIIENEANAGAYGEKRFGAGQEYQNILYISAGIGIGVGLILGGELYQGSNGYSGEAGHMLIEMDGRNCSCGRKGCWEAYASEHALLESAQTHFNKEIKLEELILMATTDEETVHQLFEQTGKYLGYGIANLINLFNPEQVIIGNRLSVAKPYLLDGLQSTIQQQGLPFHQQNLHITFSKLSTYSTALGVSAFAVENFFNEQQLVEQI
jgi:predicted NBD/HSP70 family sugar kinase/DNA-binding XRE family transcriptional regulator